ncbi:thiol-disulfide oxidoreductase [Pseudoalteromonas sp. A25]|nr:thiol-disulfide oxidoreductase [Pseudoalteromonas sp. A25]
MKSLQSYDQQGCITLVDLHDERFPEQYPDIDRNQALKVLHLQDCEGTVWFGLDATYQAWKAVGKHRWLKVLRIVPIRWAADWCYLFFAKHRIAISKVLMPNQCARSGCNINE